MRKVVRVAVVEPSEIICEGLRSLLVGSEYEVVYTAGSMRALLDRLPVLSLDMVIVGSQLVATLSQGVKYLYADLQNFTLVMLSTTVCDDEVVRGFDAVVSIYDSREQLLRKLDNADDQSQVNPYSDSHELSERERDVLVLVAKGLANKEIADKLNISIHTVMSHRKNIAHKTGIKSVAGLTVYALLNNMLDAADVTL